MEYTKQEVIIDADGNPVDFTDLIQQKENLDLGITNTQNKLNLFTNNRADIQTQAETLYSQYPNDLPPEFILAFNL